MVTWLCNELVFWILGLSKGVLGNYYVNRDLGNELVLSAIIIINRGNYGVIRNQEIQ